MKLWKAVALVLIVGGCVLPVACRASSSPGETVTEGVSPFPGVELDKAKQRVVVRAWAPLPSAKEEPNRARVKLKALEKVQEALDGAILEALAQIKLAYPQPMRDQSYQKVVENLLRNAAVRTRDVQNLDGDDGVEATIEVKLPEYTPRSGGAVPNEIKPEGPPIAPFTLDPSGLDTLAKSLWDQCQAKAKVKSKVENGNVAVATFKPIGSLPAQIPASVAADLYTAMIKSKFELVERAQLDKVLGELKVQDTALINPATAKKIGKLAGCDLMLVGEITDSDALIVINARLMETETGKSVVAERVQLRKIFSRS